ncbi:MAG: hypothetical protein PHO12_03725 [Bacteroidales bacterium]|nr:hypothetical protein [Bacteroidales bacterium]MDD4683712.1 hypothetical protein [Bacteroidales bacterium]
MKKFITLLVIAISIIGFNSCKEDKDPIPRNPSYVNISLQDAKKHVGLDYNEVKTQLETKGFALMEDEIDSEEIQHTFHNSDTTQIYTLYVNPTTNIIYRAGVTKKGNTIKNSLSNYELCQRECIEVTNNIPAFTYNGMIDSFFGQGYTSQADFQSVFNEDKDSIFFCVEVWESSKDVYIVQYINTINIEEDLEYTETNTTTPTTTEPETIPKYFAMGVSYVNIYHMPAEIDKKSYLKQMFH